MATSLERAFYFSSKARRCLRSAIYFESVFRYPECITFSQDSIEFAGKSILEFFDVGYNKEHYLGRELENLGKKNDSACKKLLKEIARAIVISDRWLQQSRNLTKYGFMKIGLSPVKAFQKEEADLAIKDAIEINNFLSRIEIYKKFQYPIKIAILNGYANSETNETQCTNTPGILNITDWKNYLSNLKTQDGKQKYVVAEIKTSDINNEFSLIVNPFIECYPEFNIKRRLIFDIIEDYILNGGIFVCVNGFPFFYGWNVTVNQNNKVPLVDAQMVYPRRIVINNTVFIPNIPAILPFSGTLFFRRLNGKTSGDTQHHTGHYNLPSYQRVEDIRKFGRITNHGGINDVDEFRAVTHETEDIIPILRARRTDYGEVYPIVAKIHSYGYLITCGMRVTRVADRSKIFKAIDKFITWVNKNNNI